MRTNTHDSEDSDDEEEDLFFFFLPPPLSTTPHLKQAEGMSRFLYENAWSFSLSHRTRLPLVDLRSTKSFSNSSPAMSCVCRPPSTRPSLCTLLLAGVHLPNVLLLGQTAGIESSYKHLVIPQQPSNANVKVVLVVVAACRPIPAAVAGGSGLFLCVFFGGRRAACTSSSRLSGRRSRRRVRRCGWRARGGRGGVCLVTEHRSAAGY